MTKLTCDLVPWRTWQARALKENLTQTPPPQNLQTTTEGDFRRSQNCAALFLSLKSGVIVETKPTLLCCVVGRGVRVGWCSLKCCVVLRQNSFLRTMYKSLSVNLALILRAP
jgi:hypothetical protein